MRHVHYGGVDVGGKRKGFHVAVLAEASGVLRLVEQPRQIPEPAGVVAWLRRWHPRLVGVDAPRSLADHRPRFEGERRLAREVCHLRYTPSRAALRRQRRTRAPRYYEWIERGLALHAALTRAGLPAIECFPTASWTRWAGPRSGTPRARWSASALASRALAGVPALLGQDARDAIGAALTAREFVNGRCERFGDIVVPRALAGEDRPR